MPQVQLPAFADVLAAADRLRGFAVETPLLRSDVLDAAVGGKVFVKAETLQRTGSFKFRGAFNRLSSLTDEERGRGGVAVSSGNHAQGAAAAAHLLGIKAVIVMPADAPAIKMDATRAWGAEIVTYDRFTESREVIAAAVAAKTGAVVVPSYDDPYVIAGQGTIGLEVARRLEALETKADLLLSPASGGGLIAGVGLAFDALSPATALYAVEPEGYDDHGRSLAAGEIVEIVPPGPSLCDALLMTRPGALTFPLNKRKLSGALTVSDDEALAAMAFAFRHLKLVIEPGGATALAALLSGKLALDGRTAVVVASGGNVDPAVYALALALV